jgi:hypothetical protein
MKKLLFFNELVWQNLARYDSLFTASGRSCIPQAQRLAGS